MIAACDIAHFSRSYSGEAPLFANVDLRIEPRDRFGILAPSAAGKTTLARILSGAIEPEFGRILRSSSISWPLTYSSLLHPALSSDGNIRLIAGARNIDADALIARVEALWQPRTGVMARRVALLSPGARLRLIVSITLSIPFEIYLADEMPAIPAGNFRDRMEAQLDLRLQRAGLILLTRHLHLIERHCTRFAALVGGRLVDCDNAQDAHDLITFQTERAQHRVAS